MLREFHPAAVAFLDLDRTLIGKSSGELYLRTLKKKGRVSHWARVKILAPVDNPFVVKARNYL